MRRSWAAVSIVVVASTVLSAIAAGCGSSSSKQGPSPTGDAGMDASTADATPEAAPMDAGMDINQDPSVYPAQHHPIPQIDYNGGPVLQHPRIVTISFVGDAHRDSWRALDHFITKSTWWQQTGEGFCIDGGTYSGQCVGAGSSVAPDGGEWILDGSTADAGDGFVDVELPFDFASTDISDADIQTWLAGHVGAGDFPPPDDQTIYALYFPTSTTQGSISISPGGGSAPLCAPVGFGVTLGYHYQAAVTAPGAAMPVNVAYAVLPFCDLGAGDLGNFNYATSTASHEIAEAATDPQPGQLPAYYLHSNDAWAGSNSLAGGECGDLCENVNNNTYEDPTGSNGYTFQRIWSNQAAAQSQNPCQPWTNTYYGAALRTTTQMIEGHTSDGYVVVKRGQTVNVIADVFAQAKLPHDLQLYVGQNKGPYQTIDPSDVAPPGDNISVTLSQSQVNNGDGIVVTFSVPSTGSTDGDYPLVIRSVLSTDDYNDWPVIVHVQ